LGYEYAEKLHGLLDRSGLYGEFVSFSGGHEIPPKAIDKIASYLKSCLKTRH
jgi:predicted esterase